MLENTTERTVQYSTSWAIEIIAYPAVDIFALITGYVSYSREGSSISRTYSSLFMTWMQVVYWCLFVTGLVWIINPEWVTHQDLFQCLFPVSNNAYWYFTAYTGAMILSPLIKVGVQSLTDKSSKCLFFTIVFTFSFYTVLSDYFKLKGGYSTLWILLLYIEGAIMKKIDLGSEWPKAKSVILIIVLYVTTWAWKIYSAEIGLGIFRLDPDSLVSYTSPTILGISIIFSDSFF